MGWASPCPHSCPRRERENSISSPFHTAHWLWLLASVRFRIMLGRGRPRKFVQIPLGKIFSRSHAAIPRKSPRAQQGLPATYSSCSGLKKVVDGVLQFRESQSRPFEKAFTFELGSWSARTRLWNIRIKFLEAGRTRRQAAPQKFSLPRLRHCL